MDDSVIAGLFALGGTILGSVLSWATYKLQRKGPFVEHVYREKFEVYRRLTKTIGYILAVTYAANSQKQYGSAIKMLQKNRQELFTCVSESRLLIPRDILQQCVELAFLHVAKIHENQRLTDEQLTEIAKLATQVERKMRNDIGMESLSMELLRSLNTSPRPL